MDASKLEFGSAMTALKEGKRIARRDWKEKGMFVVKDNGHLMIRTVGSFVPWLAESSDLLAEDWELV